MTATRTIEEYVNLERCVDALEDELVKLRKDAARYQWLKRQPWVKTKGIHAWGDLLDNAIDEARHDAPTETPNARLSGRQQP